jgi:hypothetical protein
MALCTTGAFVELLCVVPGWLTVTLRRSPPSIGAAARWLAVFFDGKSLNRRSGADNQKLVGLSI